MHARLNRSCNTTTSHTLLGPSPIRYIKLASLLYPYTRLRFECMPTVLTYMSRVVERCPAIQVDMRFTTCRAGQNFMYQCCLSNGSLRGHRGYCRAHCVTAASRVRARNLAFTITGHALPLRYTPIGQFSSFPTSCNLTYTSHCTTQFTMCKRRQCNPSTLYLDHHSPLGPVHTWIYRRKPRRTQHQVECQVQHQEVNRCLPLATLNQTTNCSYGFQFFTIGKPYIQRILLVKPPT